jgi:PAS domain S-box-containing protein
MSLAAPAIQLTAARAGTDRADWWRFLFNEAEDAQFVCIADGTVIEVNRRAARLFGLPVQDPPPRALHPILTASTFRRLRDHLARNPDHPETFSAVSIQCEDRVGMVADLTISSLGGPFWLLAFKDASRRWRLETHAQRLITAVDSTSDVVLLADSQFRLTFVNAAFQIATGYTIEDSLGRSLEFLRSPLDHSKIAECNRRLHEGHDWSGEFTNLRADGTELPVEVCISPIFGKTDEFLGCVSFERDVSAKKRLQNELLLERNFVRSIINSLESAIYTVDRQFRLTHINDAWRKLPPQHGWLTFQGPPQTGLSLLDYVADPTRRAELRTQFINVLMEGRPQEHRITQGEGRHWLINIIPWRHDEEIRGLIYKVTDNTQFINLQNQLYQAQKMETIGALAAGVAHDFNNLLLAIRGNVSLLLLDESVEQQHSTRLKQIDQAAVRAAEITQQLLSFSRASDEHITILDFNQVIQEAAQLARRTARGKIGIKLEPSPRPVKVQMDSTRAQQLLLNLCVNAQDAMPEGGKLTITNSVIELTPAQAAKAQKPAGTAFVRCTIADTGTGIPPEILSRIFDPFFTTKGQGKGTGLGLAIVQSVVAKAGGFLEVDSEVGRGTCFHIYLPLDQGPVSAAVQQPQSNLNAGTGRILVVDDLDMVLEFTGSFLHKAGYEILTAISADEAIRILAQQTKPVDLMFTDFNMPGKNGWQLIQEVAPKYPTMRIVLSSGYLDDAERFQIESKYRVRILNKPYNISEATQLISEVMAGTK